MAKAKKSSARKSPPTKRSAEREPAAPAGVVMNAPDAGVAVRMYRTGLGDCFLLALPRKTPTESGRHSFYILVDCGVYFRTPAVEDPDTKTSVSQEEWIREIAQDIKAATGGRIDLLMITHEHWDHVSAFDESQARGIFETIELGALWLPWTEDMSLELARKLKAEGGADQAALARAATAMVGRGMLGADGDGLPSKVLRFFGAAKSNNYSVKTGAAMAWVQHDYTGKYSVTPKYLHPGGPIETFDGVDERLARLYILGPPEDERVIKVLDRAGTTYRMGIGWASASTSFLAFGVVPSSDGAAPPTDEDIADAQQMSVPFDHTYQIPSKNVKAKAVGPKKPENNEATKPEANPLFGRYFDSSNAWRRIDGDWAAPIDAFALQLDNKTNNTSLAFALEIGPPGSGKVLLFPGDAQIGNWLSWFGPVQVQGEQDPVGPTPSWTVPGKTVTAEDLLRRTVFYKVGHHGSHNATLKMRDKKPSGLMLMESKDLVAMIPVDEYVARKVARYGEMPRPSIVDDLLARAGRKVARNDEDRDYNAEVAPTLHTMQATPRPKLPGELKCPLYIQCTVVWE